jgi:hypothetical protein
MASVKNHGNENGIYTCHERAMKIYKLKMKWNVWKWDDSPALQADQHLDDARVR